jgi:hypothetical protein
VHPSQPLTEYLPRSRLKDECLHDPPKPDPPTGLPVGKIGLEDAPTIDSKYSLSQAQRKAVKNEQASADRTEKIVRKRDLLPERVENLLYDVGLLGASSFTAKENWDPRDGQQKQTRQRMSEILEEIDSLNDAGNKLSEADPKEIDRYESPYDSPEDFWAELIDVPVVNGSLRDDMYMWFPRRKWSEKGRTKEMKLGFELGSMLRGLRPEQQESVPGIELIWGFLLAFIGQPQEQVAETEQEYLTKLSEELKVRQSARQKHVENMTENPTAQEYLEERQEHFERIEEALRDAGVTPHSLLTKEIEQHTDTSNINTPERFVTRMVEALPLREVDTLSQQVKADVETLNEKAKRGLPAKKPLECHWKKVRTRHNLAPENPPDGTTDTEDPQSQYSDLTSQLIATAINKDQRQVTEVYNELAHISETKAGERWTDVELLREKSPSNGKDWELTAYGTVVCTTMFNYDEEIDWLYEFVMGPEKRSLAERRLILNAMAAHPEINSTL